MKTLNFDPGPTRHHNTMRSKRWVLTGCSLFTFYFLIPVSGGFSISTLCYNYLPMSEIESLGMGMLFAYLAWKLNPHNSISSWQQLFVELIKTALVSGLPYLTFLAVYWPLKLSERLPSYIPAWIVAIAVAFQVYSYSQKQYQHWSDDRSRSPRGRAEGEGMQGNLTEQSIAITLEATRKYDN